MPYNIDNTSEWITSVRGVSTSDQVEGGPGGVANFSAVDLTKRTNWLKDQLLRQVVEIVPVNSNTSVTVADVGKAYLFTGLTSGTPLPVVQLPAVASIPEGYGFYFQHEDPANDRMGRIVPNGSETINVFGSINTNVTAKPGRGGFWIVRNGSTWRLMGNNPLEDVGVIMPFPRNSPPQGWIECGDVTLSRTAFADLFAIIGTNYNVGGVPSDQFMTPNLYGEFIRGWDRDGLIDVDRVFGSKQPATTFNGHIGTQPGSEQLAQGVAYAETAGSDDYSFRGRVGTSLAGSAIIFRKSAVRPRNMALLYCIKF